VFWVCRCIECYKHMIYQWMYCVPSIQPDDWQIWDVRLNLIEIGNLCLKPSFRGKVPWCKCFNPLLENMILLILVITIPIDSIWFIFYIWVVQWWLLLLLKLKSYFLLLFRSFNLCYDFIVMEYFVLLPLQ